MLYRLIERNNKIHISKRTQRAATVLSTLNFEKAQTLIKNNIFYKKQ